MHRSFENVVVLECSQIRSLDEFWDLYARDIAVSGREHFGRNLDALHDALAGGPGWPGVVWLELHNVEALEGRGHEAFVAALERIGQERERSATGPGLRVVRKGAPPRGRLFQHARFVSRELTGAVIERAVCWRPRRHDPSGCGILWIKPSDRAWQRFFLDDGFACWEEWSAEATVDEFAELADEVDELPTIVGERLGAVTVEDGGAVVPTLRIALGAAREIRLAPRNSNDISTDAFLELK